MKFNVFLDYKKINNILFQNRLVGILKMVCLIIDNKRDYYSSSMCFFKINI